MDKPKKLPHRNIPVLILVAMLAILAASWMYYFRPIVSMQGKLISRTQDSAIIHVWGTKFRAKCRFLEINTYASKNGVLHDTTNARIDMVSKGETKPAGDFDIGHWQITPVTDAERVVMYVTHTCADDDLHITKIADVPLRSFDPVHPNTYPNF